MLSELEVNNIIKRKCENYTNQTCTQSKKKRQKIYRQHYDHTYAKKITIIYFVNDDCLKEIFTYISACERPKIAQVCKNWNRIFHSYYFKVNKLALSHWEYDSPQNALEKFGTNEKKLNFLKSLLVEFNSHLTELDLIAYGNSNIVPFINKSCPNLEKLRLRLKDPYQKRKLKNAFSRMPKLRVIKIIFQSVYEIPNSLFRSLKNVASTLNELSLIHEREMIIASYSRTLSILIPKLKALKKLETSGMLLTSFQRKVIADAKINLNHHEDSYEMPATLTNPSLLSMKYLELHENKEFTDDMLHSIANKIGELESLSGDCSLVTDVGIQAITKMKHLKRLYLFGKSNITDSPLKLLKGLEVLRLPGSYKITNDSVEKILQNSPYMKELYITHTSITPEFIITAKKLSKKRENYLELYVHFSSCCVGQIETKCSI